MPANPLILAGLKDYIANKTGGPIVPGLPIQAKNIAVQKTPLDTTADIRDSIGALVGSGYTKRGTDKNIDAHSTRILQTLGSKAGQDLLTHIQVFNSRPDIVKYNPVQRLQTFYDIQSGNPETQALIAKAKAFGTGPIAAYSETPEITNQQLAAAPVIVKK